MKGGRALAICLGSSRRSSGGGLASGLAAAGRRRRLLLLVVRPLLLRAGEPCPQRRHLLLADGAEDGAGAGDAVPGGHKGVGGEAAGDKVAREVGPTVVLRLRHPQLTQHLSAAAAVSSQQSAVSSSSQQSAAAVSSQQSAAAVSSQQPAAAAPVSSSSQQSAVSSQQSAVSSQKEQRRGDLRPALFPTTPLIPPPLPPQTPPGLSISLSLSPLRRRRA